MVTLYIGGEKVGTLGDSSRLFAEFIARKEAVEFRDDAGELLARYVAEQFSTPSEPLIPWDSSITQADIDRIKSGPFFTFEEVKERLGFK